MEDFEKRVNGYKFNHNNILRDQSVPYQTLILDKKEHLKKSIKYILKNKINQIEIRHELNQADINELYELRNADIKGLSIENINNKDNLSFLNEFTSLEALIITSQQPGSIDFKKLINLQYFNNSSIKVDLVNLDSAKNLTGLVLQNYRKGTLPDLSNTKLRSFDLYFSDIVSLDFLSGCSTIDSVRIEGASKLISIDGLKASSNSLNSLDLIKCKKIDNYDVLLNFTNLQYLRLLNCSNIENTNILESLPNLKRGIINIDIIDGNVDRILELPIVFKNYKHFSSKNIHSLKLGKDGRVYLYRGKTPLYAV